MDDDFSDLTDLDELSQEYEERPTKKKGKGKAKAKSGEYRIRHALKAPRATTYSTEALYKQIHNGDIDLEPEYQREVVWPESKQIGIIDSIYRNFYVPPVIFAVNVDDDGTETRTCIDGKQRLTSIYRFVEGLIPHKDSLTGDKLWYRDNPDHSTRGVKKILPERYRRMFDNRAVVCVEYQDLTDADEREIFQRVQLGVALTPAEKLKVLATPRAQFVRTLQDDFLNNESSGLGGTALAWDRSRGSDFRCLSQTIQCIAVSPKTTSIQATEKWLADPTPMTPAFAASIENTYSVFEALVRDSRHKEVFAKIAPIEFITVGILVHRHKSRLTLDALGKAVQAMRADVRSVHDDIRNNGKVYKTMNAFIDGYESPPLARGEICAADAVGSGFVPIGSGAARAGTKRKAGRGADEDDEDHVGGDDSDDDYAPAKRAAPAPRKRANPKKPSTTATKAPPTPPASTSTASAPPPGSPAVPLPTSNVGMDVIRQAKERLESRRLAGELPIPPQSQQSHGGLPTPNLTPYPYEAYAAHHQQNIGFQQQQQQHGPQGVAAALLEAGLMGASRNGAPNGPRVKTEAGPPPPFSAGRDGSYDGGGSGRWSRSGSGSGHHRNGAYERRDEYDEYRSDKRYRGERDSRGGRGSW